MLHIADEDRITTISFVLNVFVQEIHLLRRQKPSFQASCSLTVSGWFRVRMTFENSPPQKGHFNGLARLARLLTASRLFAEQ